MLADVLMVVDPCDPLLALSLRRPVTKADQMKRKAKRRRTPRRGTPEPTVDGMELLREAGVRRGTSPVLSGGDVDADWRRAESAGEEPWLARWPHPIRTS
jgi:hypothetical protein